MLMVVSDLPEVMQLMRCPQVFWHTHPAFPRLSLQDLPPVRGSALLPGPENLLNTSVAMWLEIHFEAEGSATGNMFCFSETVSKVWWYD